MSDRYQVIYSKRNRTVYGLFVIITLLLGLGSRRFFGDVSFIKDYVGDMLWALMVYFGFAFVFNKWAVNAVALTTIAFSFGIEISQLYHASWIDDLRATRMGGLVLGFSFVWSDLLCYSVGVLIGMFVDTYVMRGVHRGESKDMGS